MLILADLLDDPSDIEKLNAVNELYNLRMLRFAYAIIGNEIDAAEAVENALGNLAIAFHRISHLEMDRIGYYFLTTVRNEACTMLRKRCRTVVVDDMEEIAGAATTLNPENALISDEKYKKILAIIAALPATYYDTLSMHCVDNMSAKDISAFTGEPLDTVRSRIRRGRKILREALIKEEIR